VAEPIHGEEPIHAGLQSDCGSRTHLPVSPVPKSVVGDITLVGRGSGALGKWMKVASASADRGEHLLSPTLDRQSVEAERLLARWGKLHAVRSVLSGVALLLFLYLAIFGKQY
jgi:hypothetical protein